jgi:hypothetical protein
MGAVPYVHNDPQEPDVPDAVARSAADSAYEAALADLLAEATTPPGRPHGLQRAIWSALRALHARQREAAERLPPEYWFWPH